jgi:hypothetical protein
LLKSLAEQKARDSRPALLAVDPMDRIRMGTEASHGDGDLQKRLSPCCKFVTVQTIRNNGSSAAAKLSSFVAAVYALP